MSARPCAWKCRAERKRRPSWIGSGQTQRRGRRAEPERPENPASAAGRDPESRKDPGTLLLIYICMPLPASSACGPHKVASGFCGWGGKSERATTVCRSHDASLGRVSGSGVRPASVRAPWQGRHAARCRSPSLPHYQFAAMRRCLGYAWRHGPKPS